MKRRVVITGMGIVSPIGIGVSRFWNNLKDGKSGVNVITQFNPKNSPCKLAAEIKNYNPKDYFDETTIRMNPRYAQFALIAAKEAIKSAKIDLNESDQERTGVILGTSAAGLTFSLEQQNIFKSKGIDGMDTYITSIMNNGVGTRAISLKYKTKGWGNTFTSTCVASTDAIGHSMNLIRDGYVDMMITGGAEACIFPSTIAGFYLGRILSKKDNLKEKTPRPFDLHRDGTIIAEGAAILFLEELSHAKKRKAEIIGEIVGYGASSDAYHYVKPNPDGEQGVRAVKMALKDARVSISSIDYINAHGTGTKRNDLAETVIIKKVFGKRSYEIPMSATKSITGHPLGAAGAFEAIISLLTIKKGVIPATINLTCKDPQCDLDYVPNKARPKKVKTVLSNSFGFGGFNSSLVFRKYE